ncbi:phage tail sheath protein [Sphingomonas cavernae]|uniref:Phage tail sheath protein n=1 Tax=Sphingomonas cavernae TaxID=2320861 RepID=A0A418WP27_9SPHN|nr:phage tail sheath protein [Sphingomonas cavernae]RJF92992.1 phage tail sheath protein [Sphingomonas cavernae]
MPIQHGIKIIEINEGVRTLSTVATAIIGIVATGPAADAVTFPLNKPVRVTNLADAIEKAGATGTLRKALQAIYDQAQPVVVVVRVTPGADEAATNTAVIGGTVEGQKTGMQALLAAEAQIGVKPRIIGCPGLDTQAVTTALVSVAQKLRAFAYASCWDCDSVEDAVLYRASFSARELMLIWPDFLAWNVDTSAADTSFAVARALGLRARIDQEVGFHKTISNFPVNGVTGLTHDVHWDLQSSANDAGLLNDADITTIVNANGRRFWGNRTTSDEPLFAFESATRTAQVLMDTIAEGLLWAIDKPLRPSLIRDIVETINAKFRAMKAAGLIIDGQCWYDASVNTTDQLKTGKVVIDYDYTLVPPLEGLTLNQRITDRYLADFAADLGA